MGDVLDLGNCWMVRVEVSETFVYDDGVIWTWYMLVLV